MLTIRASMLPSYCDCPRRAAARIIRREIEEAGYTLREPGQGIAALIGTAFHAGAGTVIAGKLLGATVNLASATELSITTLRERTEAAATSYDTTTPTLNDGEQQIKTLTACFYHDVVPKIFPAMPPETERTGEMVGALLSGHIDVETTAQEIWDYKTGRVKKYHAQMGMYSRLRAADLGLGELPGSSGLKIVHLQRTPVKKPFQGANIIECNVGACERISFYTTRALIRDVNNFIKTKNPYAFTCNPDSTLCSPKYCPCHGTEFCEVTL